MRAFGTTKTGLLYHQHNLDLANQHLSVFLQVLVSSLASCSLESFLLKASTASAHAALACFIGTFLHTYGVPRTLVGTGNLRKYQYVIYGRKYGSTYVP